MKAPGTTFALLCFCAAFALLGLALQPVFADDPPSYGNPPPAGTLGLALCNFGSSNCTHYDKTSCQAPDDPSWNCSGSFAKGIKLYDSRSYGICSGVPTGGVDCPYWNPINCAILSYYFEDPNDPAACRTRLCYIMVTAFGGGFKYCLPTQTGGSS